MIYLLDTNVISEFHKLQTGRCNKNVLHWLSTVYPDQLAISVITHMEIKMGILRLEHRNDFAQARNYQEWYQNEVVQKFSNATLPVTTEVATLCAEFHVPNKRPVSDSLIAATAMAHNLTLVTRNTKDFQGLNLKLFNPFEFSTH